MRPAQVQAGCPLRERLLRLLLKQIAYTGRFNRCISGLFLQQCCIVEAIYRASCTFGRLSARRAKDAWAGNEVKIGQKVASR